MANLDDAFVTEFLSINDEVVILTGATAPDLGLGVEAQIGSLFLLQNGDVYTKIGPGNTEWRLSTDWGPELRHKTGDPSGFESQTDSVISFNNATRTFTIAPTASEFTIWFHGVPHTFTAAQTVVIPNSDGMHSIYFDGGVLKSTQTISEKTLILEYCLVGAVYWSTVHQEALTVSDDRHQVIMDRTTHYYLHLTRGTAYASGLAINNFSITGDGTSNAHAQFGITSGTICDEDVTVNITATTTPSAIFEQDINPIAHLPIIYRDGSSDWYLTSGDEYALCRVSGVPKYNQFSGGWVLTTVPNGAFVATWVIAAPEITHPVMGILGQRYDTTIEAAKENNKWGDVSVSNFPLGEYRLLYRVIFEIRSTFTNDVTARIVDVLDLRTTSVVSLSASAHSSETLAGLADVNLTSPLPGEALVYNGTDWVNQNIVITDRHVAVTATDTAPGNLADKLIQGHGLNFVQNNLGGNETLTINVGGLSSLDVGLNNVTNSLQVINAGGAPSIQEGTLAARPAAGVAGRIYIATDTMRWYRDNGLSWVVGGSDPGVTSVAATAPSAGFTISGSPITTSGTFVFALSDDLAAVEGLATTGLAARTAANTWTTRTITGPAEGLTIANGNGVAGNPTIALANDLSGLENLSTTGVAVRTGTSTWTTRSLVAPAAGLTISNNTGVSGNPTFALANDLGAIEALDTNGFYVRTATDTWAARSITSANSTRIVVSNGNGTLGDPAIDLATVTQTNAGTFQKFTVDSYGRVVSTAPVTAGDISALGFSSTASVSSVAATAPAAGLTISGSPITTSGTLTFALADDLAAVEGLTTTGLAVRTGTSTWTNVTISGTAGRISVTNGSGVAGNPTIDLSTVGTAGTYVSVTTDAYGRVTSGSTTQAWSTITGTPTTLAGYNITDAQPLDGDLTAIAALTGTSGLLRKTAANTWTLDTTSYLTSNQTITLSGDVTGAGSTSIATTLATVNSNVGTFGSATQVGQFTVNAKGLITAASNVAITYPVSSVFGRTGAVVAAEGDYALTQLADVTITAPATDHYLRYNGSTWVNTAFPTTSATSYSVIISAWTLDTGSYYYADVTHNLGTQNIVVGLHDTANNEFVYPDKITILSANAIRVRVFGNGRTLRCVVLANGVTMAVGGSTPSSIIVQDDGVNLAGTPHTILNFGAGIAATNAGGGQVTITTTNAILRTFSWYAASLDNPNSADWTINSLAPVVADPTNSSLLVRQFNDTTEQGVGALVTVPVGATNATFRFKGRAQTAPGAARIVQPRVYVRAIPDNAAVGPWGSAVNLTNIDIPTNAFFQYDSQTVAIGTLGMAPGNLYQIEVTRRTTGLTGGTNLTGNWLLAELMVEFT